MLVRAYHMRGKSGAYKLWSRTIRPRDKSRQNRRCDDFLSPCHICAMWECWPLKFRWFIWAGGMRNRWIHHYFRWCSWLWMNFYDRGGCVLWGFLSVPLQYKKTANVMPHLEVAPWRNICRICIGLILEAHFWIQSGGSFNCRILFLIRHIVGESWFVMNPASAKVGVHLILCF